MSVCLSAPSLTKPGLRATHHHLPGELEKAYHWEQVHSILHIAEKLSYGDGPPFRPTGRPQIRRALSVWRWSPPPRPRRSFPPPQPLHTPTPQENFAYFFLSSSIHLSSSLLPVSTLLAGRRGGGGAPPPSPPPPSFPTALYTPLVSGFLFLVSLRPDPEQELILVPLVLDRRNLVVATMAFKLLDPTGLYGVATSSSNHCQQQQQQQVVEASRCWQQSDPLDPTGLY